jgi:hypothetical protein
MQGDSELPQLLVRRVVATLRGRALLRPATSGLLTAGIPTFEIARMMGTSIEQIEQTYGHPLPDALERGRAALEAFDVRSEEAAEDER